MLSLRLEFWPRGNRKKAVVLGGLHIENTTEGSALRGTYTVELFHPDGRLERRETVRDFARKENTAWQLVIKALQAVTESHGATTSGPSASTSGTPPSNPGSTGTP